MYQKYHTEALVLGSYENGESDKTILLFTRDFGLVRARATSVRSELSKMRYASQHYSRSLVSLIKGKRGWRLAGAAAQQTAHGDVRGISAFARVAEMAVRLVAGEEKNEYLFAVLDEAHRALMQEKVPAFATIEIVCVARVLFSLGYISAEALETALFTHTAYGDPHLQEAEGLRDKLLLSINRAISETHL